MIQFLSNLMEIQFLGGYLKNIGLLIHNNNNSECPLFKVYILTQSCAQANPHWLYYELVPSIYSKYLGS
jgi:hypothetical protein